MNDEWLKKKVEELEYLTPPVVRKMFAPILLDAVKTLSGRERLIIELRFGLFGAKELTQKEVADALGISQSYISRLEKKIMHSLRKKIEEKI